MTLNESETRAKLIDPALHANGWTEDLIRREETAGAIEIANGRPRRRSHGRVDYTLRVKVTPDSQPVALALIEAKAEHLAPDHGLEQAKSYADAKRLNVPYVFSTNGHLFVMYNRLTGITDKPRKMNEFPKPQDLRTAYETAMGFRLDAEGAKPLLSRYSGGEATRRYYQDAAIRAVLEKIARGEKRALLSLATGAGKTFIAVNLLKRIGDAGQLRKALFICDRDELRAQGLAAFQNTFGADAAGVSGSNPQKNARILIATYQTLDVDSDDDGRGGSGRGESQTRPYAEQNFLTENYPENYFSHIIIDECHRSAWGKWGEVLKRNPNAVQVGLTATPRQLAGVNADDIPEEDEKITADNLKYFGEPVYEYDMAQGMDDGYLAACEVIQRSIFLDHKDKKEEETGVQQPDLKGKEVTNALTGEKVDYKKLAKKYRAGSFEKQLQLPDRVKEMCSDLFKLLLRTGGPEQKTIIFCAGDTHADKVSAEMNNLYAAWCAGVRAGLEDGQEGYGQSWRPAPTTPLPHYAFKCTSSSDGNEQLPDLRCSSRSYFIACTVDLLSTGVDVPVVENIVFFKYVRSPIAFYQMVGRGTRLNPATGKLMFRVYDYTNASRLFGKEFITRVRDDDGRGESQTRPYQPPIQVEGFDVAITEAGHSIITMVNGKAMPVTVEEYKEKLSQQLVEQAPTLDSFRKIWVDPTARQDMLTKLPDGVRSALLVRALEKMDAFDLYDVLAELGYGLAPRTRLDRAAAFTYKHADWLKTMPTQTAETLRALALQFGRGGTEALENQHVFQTPEVTKSGGLIALRQLGKPADVLRETKTRIFAA